MIWGYELERQPGCEALSLPSLDAHAIPVPQSSKFKLKNLMLHVLYGEEISPDHMQDMKLDLSCIQK
jgi:hypothetical protein